MEYLIYKINYKTAFDEDLTAVISTQTGERAKEMLGEYLKGIHIEGFQTKFVINTGFPSLREGIILFR